MYDEITKEDFEKYRKHIPISNHLKEKAKGYLPLMIFGKTYYLPITKEFRQIFKKVGDDFKFQEVLRDCMVAVYHQIRDTVGSGIKQELSQQIQDGFEKMYSDKLDFVITKQLEDKTTKNKEVKNGRKI